MTHWQRLVTKRISINDRSTYMEFCRRLKFQFLEEIDDRRNPPTFRIYTMPAMSDDIGDRVLVDDDTKFKELLSQLMDVSVPHPVIYVWNYDDASTVKLLDVKRAKSNSTSVVTRDTSASKCCKSRDRNTCLCCGYVGLSGFGLKACHIYEIGAHNRIRVGEKREEKLESLQLLSINELSNMITLCEKCHSAFDAHKLGIHPIKHTWIVTNVFREGRNSAPSGERFVDIHAKKVPFFTRYIPPKEVLEERMSHFLLKNLPTRYCHFCHYVCTNESDLNSHIQECVDTALAKSFSGLVMN